MRTLINTDSVLTTIAAIAAMLITTVAVADPLPGTDNADQSVYTNGWDTGDDGSASGDGFSGWFLASSSSNAYAGFFIGSSTNLTGLSYPDINVNGKSWGMFANGVTNAPPQFAYADAYRWFVAPDGVTHTTLGVGQTFSIDIAVNFRNGFKGIDLRDASDNTFFNFNIGGDDYVVSGSGVTSGAGTIGNAYSDNTVFRLAFTQNTTTGGTWTITRTGGVSDLDSGTYTNVPQSFKLYVGNTDTSGSANDLYANNLSISTAQSSLLITSISRVGTNVNLVWNGLQGSNVVQISTGNASGHYTGGYADLATNVLSSPGSTSYTHVGGAAGGPSRYYRVRLIQP